MRKMFKELTPSQTRQELDLKKVDASPLAAFAYLDSDQNIRYDWHAHQRHQLIYAFSGTLRLEADNGIYLLPPQRAAWIPAGVSHRTTLRNVVSASVFFAPELVSTEPAQIRIIPAAPILREMVHYALRWPPDRDPDDGLAASYFKTMGLLCGEWLKQEAGFRLPTGKSKQITAAMEYTLAHLDQATLAEAAHAAALSPRHFRRRFLAECTIGWQQFHHQARMLRAMELLAAPQASVTEVAYAIGFNSLSGFAKSFARFVGQSPKEYRGSGVVGSQP